MRASSAVLLDIDSLHEAANSALGGALSSSGHDVLPLADHAGGELFKSRLAALDAFLASGKLAVVTLE